jgi:hypothetical protein
MEHVLLMENAEHILLVALKLLSDALIILVEKILMTVQKDQIVLKKILFSAGMILVLLIELIVDHPLYVELLLQ